MSEPVRILGFGGSLRKGSYSKALLHAAVELVPKNAVLELFEIKDFLPFNADEEDNPPHIVVKFKERIRSLDAILISTPEYNYSVPGFLKNAMDWASRPYGDNAFEGKPVAIMSSSPGSAGGARAQYHLRQSFVFLNMYPINEEVIVSNADKKVGEDGKVHDEKTRDKIKGLLESLIEWTKVLGKPPVGT